MPEKSEMALLCGETRLASYYKSDKRWSDRFLPEIKTRIAQHLLIEADEEEDQYRNTDLRILIARDLRIACRIRRPQWVSNANEFTLRTERPKSGNKTELQKVLDGFGDYFFYGISDIREIGLAYWRFCDLNVFRKFWAAHLAHYNGKMPGWLKANKDGSSTFRVFRYESIGNGFVVACSGEPVNSRQASCAACRRGCITESQVNWHRRNLLCMGETIK